MNATHAAVAETMAGEIVDAAATHGPPAANERLPCLLAVSRAARKEPICTPASPLAVGICASEALRRWMIGKTRKNDPCLKHLGVSVSSFTVLAYAQDI